jgi:sulfoxide reductase heme-binding subunit YedZ
VGTRDRESNANQKRLRLRLLKHHLPLLALSALAVFALYVTRPYSDVLSRASFATAYPALVALSATLLVGPWNLVRKLRNPVSSDLRRDLGIWAAILGILHSAIGQCVHLRGRPWLYYVYAAKEKRAFPLRHDLFGLANYTGLACTMLVIALLATSNDYSLRKLGTPRWKQLQRWNYAAFGILAVHSFAYQVIEKQKQLFVATVIFCVAITLLFQFAGIMRRRYEAIKRSQFDGGT